MNTDWRVTASESSFNEFSDLCRGCLAQSGEMKNMYEWGLDEDFAYFTNVQLIRSDNISELLCMDCEDTLINCRKFRAQCQNNDKLLKTTAKNKNPPSPKELKFQQNTVNYLNLNDKIIIQITAPDMISKIYIPCLQCNQKFIKRKDLLSHMTKNHGIGKKIDIELQYYCNVPECIYYFNSGKQKYFKERKFLNQHINKMHMDKIFRCQQCCITFSTSSSLERHLKTCNVIYLCQVCNISYDTNEKLLVHLLRKHPDLHKQYKEDKKILKRKPDPSQNTDQKRPKSDQDRLNEFFCDSPKRSSATQTLSPEDNIRNDVTLPAWHTPSTKTDEISTQTVFEDLISLKSQSSDDLIFFSENVSLSDIQTQTFPLEFGLSRSNKETITSETQSPDLSIKETQTCFCLYDSPKLNFRLFDSVNSSPSSLNLTSTETQTLEMRSNVKSDVLLSFNSAETQTSFDDSSKTNL